MAEVVWGGGGCAPWRLRCSPPACAALSTCRAAGRVKTLHPGVHGGILARRDLPAHMSAIEQHGIATIDLVIVNLYPFRQTVTAATKPSYEASKGGQQQGLLAPPCVPPRRQQPARMPLHPGHGCQLAHRMTCSCS